MDGLEGFEFFQIILEKPSSRLRLPDKFTMVLLHGGKPQEAVKLREAGHGRRLWDVKVVLDADGHMYLGSGWEQFARAHDLRLGYFLEFSYDGDAVLTVKVFDVNMCRRHYKHDNGASSGSSSDGDNESKNSSVGDSGSNDGGAGDNGTNNSSMVEMEVENGPTSQFSAMLRKCNLGKKQEQYLNVPVDFQLAHAYAERSKVELRMRGKSWPVHLKHNPKTSGRPRASFRYGWHQFCVDNSLGEGDTCFFRAIRQGSGGGDDHLLKVEVRKPDGSFLV
ncbi:B3 domain-containing protein Os03g0212300-like [Hordeum vulgare subsp. vulgare]|uniref:TF-B3 domain-containing protein n=1 Tax=Hordeum vulgare subsp. vulgare TaxID=112509 RepID=A0A287PJ31_HORVV|nr:B3 domain-containing protein Os03g0212300-like [Hordeum vulgare subsp. vulgare]